MQTKILLQNILDNYGAGVFVVDVKMQKVEPPKAVIDAFDDVQRARQDKEREQNEAEAYANDILPKAQGEAARMVQEATAYREKLIKEAMPDAKIEIQDLAGDGNKIIIDSIKGGQGVVPYLPLNELQKRSVTDQSAGGQ